MAAKNITISKSDLQKLIKAELKKKLKPAVTKVLQERQREEMLRKQTPEYKEQQYLAAIRQIESLCR